MLPHSGTTHLAHWVGSDSMADQGKIRTVVWGTGNVGRAAIRAIDAHPGLELTAVIVANPEKVGRDAGDLARLGRSLGVAATDDADAVLATSPGAVVYAASGEIRPDDAAADIIRALSARPVIRIGRTSLPHPGSTPDTNRAPPPDFAAASIGSRNSAGALRWS